MPIIPVKAFHSSGRWDRSPVSLRRNIKRMRADGRSVGTRTEIGSARLHQELRRDDGWAYQHPMTAHGLADCSIEWDTEVWKRLDLWVKQITDVRVHTREGFLLPPTYLVGAVLQHVRTGAKVEFTVTHRNLRNTALRRGARAQEAKELRRHFREQRTKHPDRGLVFQYDENANQRLVVNRAALWATVQRGTGMHNLWAGNLPARAGTHGTSLLDVTLSTLPGRSYLLGDDGSSDHRPYGSSLVLLVKS